MSLRNDESCLTFVVAGHNEHELAEIQFEAGEDHRRSERKDRSTGMRSSVKESKTAARKSAD